MATTQEKSGTHALSPARTANRSERGVGKRVAQHARNYLADEMHERRRKSSTDVSSLAKSLRLTSEQLENNLASPWLGMIAGGLDRLAKALDDGDLRDLGRAVSNLSRREPALFYAGMFVIGFGGARFLKSTASEDTARSTQSTQGTQGTQGTQAGTKPERQS